MTVTRQRRDCDLNPGPFCARVQHANHSATEPPWNCSAVGEVLPRVKLGRIPRDLRSGTSYLRSTTSNNRSCTSQLRSSTFLLGSTTLHSLYLSIFFCTHDVLYERSPSRSFCHLHLSMLGVDRCCKLQTQFKCHKSQTESLECTKTPGRRSGTPPLL